MTRAQLDDAALGYAAAAHRLADLDAGRRPPSRRPMAGQRAANLTVTDTLRLGLQVRELGWR